MFGDVRFIWKNGEIIPFEDATTHVLTHSLHYGVGVFEGIRCYQCSDGSAVFRLDDHIDRLFDSAKILLLKMKYDTDDIRKAITGLIDKNELSECYIRPIVYYGCGSLGIYVDDTFPVETVVAVWPWGTYLGEEALENGVRVKTSSFVRYHVNSMATRAKATGNYLVSVLAKREAILSGYEEAIFLDADGYVSEGTGENIFIVKDDIIYTTPITSVLKGITRDSIMVMAKDCGYKVEEKRFTKDDIYIADEAFFTGTAVEVTPIRELDNRIIGKGCRGAVTGKLQNMYFDTAHGKNKKYVDWLTYL